MKGLVTTCGEGSRWLRGALAAPGSLTVLRVRGGPCRPCVARVRGRRTLARCSPPRFSPAGYRGSPAAASSLLFGLLERPTR